MSKYTWSGGIDDSVLMEVVACRGSMAEQPDGLVVNKDHSCIEVDASERFMVVLKINGKWVASLPAHEVIRRAWDN